ncbi:MAG: conjugative transfer signal peptidase TraF [Rhizobiaceae bacterium]|nr:conjugative transfer signal peptidase TraF [Rhizobiaceae bacterium]
MKRRWQIALVTALLMLPVAVLIGGCGLGLRANLTPSYPLGLWRINTLDREIEVGDLIFICPPLNAEFQHARERGYLRRGLCPGWQSPLIKTVVALPGQSVAISGSVTVDGREIPESKVQPFDGSGRSLMPFTGGIVPNGTLFLHSTFGGSYDSRYFGPIPAIGVLGLAEPLLTRGP